MGSTETKAKRPQRRSRSFAADAFVVLAMTLTTVALAIGLYLQFRLAFWLAVVAALSVYVGLLALHALVRRSEKVDRLTAEIERLELELHHVSAGVKPASAAMAAPVAGPVAGPAPGFRAEVQRTAPHSAPSVQAPLPPLIPVTSAAPVAPSTASAPLDAPRGPRPVPSADTAERGVSDRAVDAIMNDYWAFRPSQPPRLGEAALPQSADFAPAAADGHMAAVKPPPMPVSKSPPTMPLSPREADVEMIQGLVKKLADEVNAAEASLLNRPAASDRVPPAAIEASVNALRTTADQMRGPTATDTELLQAKGEARPASPRPRTAPPAAPKPSAWGDMIASAAEGPVAMRPEQRNREQVRAEVPAERTVPVERNAPVVAQPPPLPATTPVADVGPPPPAAQKGASPRHAMDRPVARQLPSQFEADSYASMPWPEDNGTGMDEPRSYEGGRADASPATPVAKIAHSRLAALAEAITAGRLDVLLDPILGLADQRARHFEVSVRLKDKNGQVLEPPDGVPELRESGLLPLLDCARIQRSAQVASRLADRGKPGALFSAFSGEALTHDQFLADFADLYSAREGLSTQLVLSFGQADVRGFAGRDWDTIAEMRELGFRFALQSISDLDMDIEALKSAGFDFVKLDASVFLDGMPASGGVVPAGDICRHLAQLGMTLIVGQIEDEAQLARIFGFGVIYGQGQFFGGARPMKAEALGEAGHAAA